MKNFLDIYNDECTELSIRSHNGQLLKNANNLKLQGELTDLHREIIDKRRQLFDLTKNVDDIEKHIVWALYLNWIEDSPDIQIPIL